MEADSPSRTALVTALMRARHARADPCTLLADPWGDRLVPQAVREAIARRAATELSPQERSAAGDDPAALADAWLRSNPAYPNVITRSRYTEDALHAAIARGVRQYVLVGAGLDSYALRLPPEAAGLRVFEIDHPATQGFKLRRLHEEGIALPAAARFVAADLAQEALADALGRTDYDPRALTFFSWLGVTMYLTREANLAALRAMATCAAAGSELVFTYTDQEAFDAIDEPRFARFREMQQRVSAVGEPYLSGFRPGELPQVLAATGFELLEDQSDADLLRRYDPQALNGLKAGTTGRIARARVRISGG